MSGEADAAADDAAGEETGQSTDPTASAPGATDTAEEIMHATYCALCKHGYADLTTQDIADESATSKAALHYHYDTKEELLLSFLDHLYDAFTDEYCETEGDHAVERLVTFVDSVLRREDAESDQAFQTALLEIRAQAPFAEGYREQLTAFDEFVRERVAEIVADGIAEGTIREGVDPGDTAAFVATMIDGVNTRRVSIGGTDCGTRRTFLAYVDDHLVAPDADVVVDPDDTDADETDRAGSDRADTDAETARTEREGGA